MIINNSIYANYNNQYLIRFFSVALEMLNKYASKHKKTAELLLQRISRSRGEYMF